MKAVERIFALMNQMSRGQATRQIPVAEGVLAVLNDDYRVSHVQNTIIATAGADGDGVMAGLDLLAAEHRHPHLNFWIDDQGALANALQPDLAARNLKRENIEILVHSDSPGSPASASASASTSASTGAVVEVVSGEQLDPVVRAGWRTDLPDADEDTVRQLVDRRGAYEAAIDTTYLAVLIDDVPVSRATLYRSGTVGQVEDVNTHPDHRGRGYARATVLAGVERLRAQGCDLVFLEADEDDWPRELYFKLGFTQLAPLPTFTGPD